MRTLLLLIVLNATLLVQGQEPDSVRSIHGRYDAFTTDELGNVYTLQGDVLAVFDALGRPIARNSLKTFGRITTMDAFYSLKPMVFSTEQAQLGILDNTLSIQTVLNLPKSGFPQVSLACASVQNAFWFFDDREMALVRVDPQLRTIANTGRLDQLLGMVVKPLSMHENDNWLYVNVPKEGLLVFDLFGTYDRTIPIVGASSFEVRGQFIHFLKDGEPYYYDRRNFTTNKVEVDLTNEEIRDLRVERGRTYLLLPDRIAVIER